MWAARNETIMSWKITNLVLSIIGPRLVFRSTAHNENKRGPSSPSFSFVYWLHGESKHIWTVSEALYQRPTHSRVASSHQSCAQIEKANSENILVFISSLLSHRIFKKQAEISSRKMGKIAFIIDYLPRQTTEWCLLSRHRQPLGIKLVQEERGEV